MRLVVNTAIEALPGMMEIITYLFLSMSETNNTIGWEGLYGPDD
jgi:hypothetical protein